MLIRESRLEERLSEFVKMWGWICKGDDWLRWWEERFREDDEEGRDEHKRGFNYATSECSSESQDWRSGACEKDGESMGGIGRGEDENSGKSWEGEELGEGGAVEWVYRGKCTTRSRDAEGKRGKVRQGKSGWTEFGKVGGWLTKYFSAVIKKHKRRSNKIYKTKLTQTKIENKVMCKYWVDPQRARLTLIAELTWSNLGLKEVLKK